MGFLFLLWLSEYLSPGSSAFLGHLALEYSPTLTVADRNVLEELTQRGLVSSPQELMDNVVSFYTVIIELLLALIGIIAAATVFYIKTSTEEKAKGYVNDKVEDKFKESEFVEKVSDVVEGLNKSALHNLEKKIEELNKLDLRAENIDELNRSVEKISQWGQKVAKRIKEFDGDNKATRKQLDLMAAQIAILDRTEELEGEKLPLFGEEAENGNP